MNTTEALKAVRMACEQYRGSLQEHQVLQQALTLLDHVCAPKKPDPEPDNVPSYAPPQPD